MAYSGRQIGFLLQNLRLETCPHWTGVGWPSSGKNPWLGSSQRKGRGKALGYKCPVLSYNPVPSSKPINQVSYFVLPEEEWMKSRAEARGVFIFFKLFSTFQFTVEAILLSPDGNIVIFKFVSFKDPNRLQLTEALCFGVKCQGSKYWQTKWLCTISQTLLKLSFLIFIYGNVSTFFIDPCEVKWDSLYNTLGTCPVNWRVLLFNKHAFR